MLNPLDAPPLAFLHPHGDPRLSIVVAVGLTEDLHQVLAEN